MAVWPKTYSFKSWLKIHFMELMYNSKSHLNSLKNHNTFHHFFLKCWFPSPNYPYSIFPPSQHQFPFHFHYQKSSNQFYKKNLPNYQKPPINNSKQNNFTKQIDPKSQISHSITSPTIFPIDIFIIKNNTLFIYLNDIY